MRKAFDIIARSSFLFGLLAIACVLMIAFGAYNDMQWFLLALYGLGGTLLGYSSGIATATDWIKDER